MVYKYCFVCSANIRSCHSFLSGYLDRATVGSADVVCATGPDIFHHFYKLSADYWWRVYDHGFGKCFEGIDTYTRQYHIIL